MSSQDAFREIADPKLDEARLRELARVSTELAVLAAQHPAASTTLIHELLASPTPEVRQAAARRRANDVAALTAPGSVPAAPAPRGAARLPRGPRLVTRPRLSPEAHLVTELPEAAVREPVEGTSETIALDRSELSQLVPAEDMDTARIQARAPERGWVLLIEGSERLPLLGGTIVLGRRPEAPEGLPGATLLRIVDVTRTVSKTHALLSHVDGQWWMTDLDSTNGILVKAGAPDEVELTPGVATRMDGPFWLGDLRAEILSEELPSAR